MGKADNDLLTGGAGNDTAFGNDGGSLTAGNSVFNASPLNSPNNIAGGFTNLGGNIPVNS